LIRELSDLPSGVIGFEASGKLQVEDYRDVLLPAMERAATSGGGIRCVIVITNFDVPLTERTAAIAWAAGES
jgi:hypothetical protein